MISDIERREVARRLREIRPCKSGHIKWWEIARALGLKQPAGWFGWEKFEPDSANRLADLIEPSCDRDALLALADRMDRDGKMQRERQKAGEHWFIDGLDVREYARRIRKALGVES